MPEENVKQAEAKVTTTAPVKFGFGQIKKATPQIANWIFRITLYAVTVSAIICNTVTEIPQGMKDLINHYGLEAVALVHALSRLFGIEVKQV